MFDGATTGQLILILLLALGGLIISGQYAINFLSRVTTALGVSEFTVAFIILAIATSMPELFVGITSSLKGASDIILSTALGSNIINITFIIGLTALLSGGVVTKQLHIQRDLGVAGAISLLPLMFLLNGKIGRVEASILLLVFAYYVFLLIRDQAHHAEDHFQKNFKQGFVYALATIIAVGALIYASDAVVSSSVSLATTVGVPSFLIGIFLLSIGTSLPELVTTMQSNKQGKPAMALGNIIGSNVANSTLVIGVAALINPIETTLHPALIVTMISVIVATGLLAYLASKGDALSVFDGLKLLAAFFIFGVVILLTGGAAI